MGSGHETDYISVLELQYVHVFNVIPAAPQLVEAGDIDYLVADYLSEITMSLLANAKQKSPVSEFFHIYQICI